MNYYNQSQVNIEVSDNPKPHEFFSYFLTEELIADWCDQTNLYGEQQCSAITSDEDLPTHSRLREWKDIGQDEMRVFLALIIATGLIQKADVDDYWSTDTVAETPFFGRHMSLRRFQNISSMFHIANNANDNLTDPLFKV